MNADSPLQLVLDRLTEVTGHTPRRSGSGYSGRCPAHDDKKPSLSVSEGSDGKVLIHCQVGCTLEAVVAELDLQKRDLFVQADRDEDLVIYDYETIPPTRVLRGGDKEFRQQKQRPDGTWEWNVKGITKVPYRLSGLRGVATGGLVFVCEGEKDADRLAREGLVATTNPGGAGKFPGYFAPYFAGLSVVVLEDNDDPGRTHAADVARKLTAHAADVKVLSLPGLADKADVSDWLNDGHNVNDLCDLVDKTREWDPARDTHETSSNGASASADADPDELELPPPSNPMAVARALLQDRLHAPTGALTLRHWRGSWMRWDGPAWTELEDRTVRSEVYRQVEHAVYRPDESKPKLQPWAPNRHKMNDLLEAVAAVAHLPRDTQPPTWLDAAGVSDGIVACANGLLYVTTRTMRDQTPHYFNEIAVPFDYDPDALEPVAWLEFLDQLWPDDVEQVGLLQQWFGYVLSGQTSLQKILGIIGPIRSGKGTICRVLRALVGERNVTAPTLSSFGQNFGLQDLIGKPVAIIGDVRLGGGESHAVVERLLSISGEDTITLDRKYRDPWTGQLPTRIMFVSNELPRFGDASGAIATRCLVLETRESWLGKEDPALTAKLVAESPAILNWALDGLERLVCDGRFIEPKSSADVVTALADLVSPISAFVRDCCIRNPLEEVPVDQLYQRWKRWAEDNGQRGKSVQTFGRDLRAVIPGLRVTRPRIGPADSQVRVYAGVALRDHS